MSRPLMKKTMAATMAAATLTAGGLALSTADGAVTPGTRTITVREKVAAVHFEHQSRKTKGDTLATGDRVQTRQKTFSTAGKRTGTLNTDCVNVGKKVPIFYKAVLLCNTSYVFRNGQIVVAGTLEFSNPSAPIVGGTGGYRGAHGVAHSGKPVKGYDSVDVLELDN